MHNDDTLLKQAADATFSALRRWQQEPCPRTEEELLTTCKHYLNSGVKLHLKPDSVEVRRA